jgi:hypothetical protein
LELGVQERVALMEWSVLVQASELERALQLFEAERDVLTAQAEAKDAEITVLRAELKTKSRVRFQPTQLSSVSEQSASVGQQIVRGSKTQSSIGRDSKKVQQPEQPETLESDVTRTSKVSQRPRSGDQMTSSWEDQLTQAETHAKAQARAERQSQQQHRFGTMAGSSSPKLSSVRTSTSIRASVQNGSSTDDGTCTSSDSRPWYTRNEEVVGEKSHGGGTRRLNIASVGSDSTVARSNQGEQVDVGMTHNVKGRVSDDARAVDVRDSRDEDIGTESSGATDWVALLDSKTGRYYYYSRAKKQTVWKLPKGARATVPNGHQQTHATSSSNTNNNTRVDGNGVQMSTLEQLQQRVLVQRKLPLRG